MGFPNGHALVVGISRYLHTTSLSRAVLTDAIDVAHVLESTKHCGYPAQNIRCLLDTEATADKFREEMKLLEERATSESTAVVYFSGHGSHLVHSENSSTSYLVFHDSNVKLRKNLISGEVLTSMLSRIRAKRLVVFLDSCFAGGAGEIKSSKPGVIEMGVDDRFCELLAGEGRAILASSCEDQVSRIDAYERNSRFTKYLLEGLKGAAASPESEVIRVTELFNYVQSCMKNLEKIQEPFFVTKLKEDFPIALAPPKKKAEDPGVTPSSLRRAKEGAGINFYAPIIPGRDSIVTGNVKGSKIGG